MARTGRWHPVGEALTKAGQLRRAARVVKASRTMASS